MAASLYLLGPQRPVPNMPRVLETVPGDGPVVCITAGWRHEEGEDDALHRDAGTRSTSLPLYAWFEELVQAAPDLAAAYHARQDEIRALKRLYRGRLGPALEAIRNLLEAEDSELAAAELEDALRVARSLDDRFIAACDRVHAQFWDEWRPLSHPLVERRHGEIRAALDGARAVLVAGGHVAILRNRLHFWGLGPLLADALERGTTIIAWSAGAMALGDRVVLFHDDPPIGHHDPEVLDRGLGLFDDVVLLPHARERLWLDDQERVSMLASRFAPRPCIGLENGAWLARRDGRWVNLDQSEAAFQLGSDGSVVRLEARLA